LPQGVVLRAHGGMVNGCIARPPAILFRFEENILEPKAAPGVCYACDRRL